MTATDWLAIYGALLATAVAVWDAARYWWFERPRLRVFCYVAAEWTPGVGKTKDNLLAYSIANTGGKPMAIKSAGGALDSGTHFVVAPMSGQFPFTLEPGDSRVVTAPMPDIIDDIKHFHVNDGVGKQWKASTKAVKESLAKEQAASG